MIIFGLDVVSKALITFMNLMPGLDYPESDDAKKAQVFLVLIPREYGLRFRIFHLNFFNCVHDSRNLL